MRVVKEEAAAVADEYLLDCGRRGLGGFLLFLGNLDPLELPPEAQ